MDNDKPSRRSVLLGSAAAAVAAVVPTAAASVAAAAPVHGRWEARFLPSGEPYAWVCVQDGIAHFNVLNVRDFGAKGNGIDDDADAFDAAINASGERDEI